MNEIPQFYTEEFPRLNIADMDILSHTAGPGTRLVLWLQGCKQNCPGCCNQNFLAIQKQHLVLPEEIIGLCRKANVEGISLSGGEPLLQAIALAPLIQKIKAEGKSILLWTGYTLESLQAISHPPEIAQILGMTDILVDGPYVQEQRASLLWRGSQNQHIHLLSRRYPTTILEHKPHTSLSFAHNTLCLTGDPNEHVLASLSQKLQAYGIKITQPPAHTRE